jgi:hypothetical protein
MFSIWQILACLLGITSVASGCTYTRLFSNTSSYNVQIPANPINGSTKASLIVTQRSTGLMDVRNTFTGTEWELGGIQLTSSPAAYCTQNCYLSFSVDTQAVEEINLPGIGTIFSGSVLYIGMQDPDTLTSATLLLRTKFDGGLTFMSGCILGSYECMQKNFPPQIYSTFTVFTLVWDVSSNYTWYANGKRLFNIPSPSKRAQLYLLMQASSAFEVDFGTSSCPIINGRISHTVPVSNGNSSTYSSGHLHSLSHSVFSSVAGNIFEICLFCLASVFMFSRITRL